MNWTRVEDGLPENGILVIVTIDFGDTRQARRAWRNWHPDSLSIVSEINPDFHVDGVAVSPGFKDSVRVTHWMPWPELPKD